MRRSKRGAPPQALLSPGVGREAAVVRLEDIPKQVVVMGLPQNKWQSPSWMQARDQLQMPPQRLTQICPASGALTDAARNIIARTFLESSEAQFLFFLDDDVLAPPDAILKLLELHRLTGAGILSGIYHRRSPPFDPLVYLRRPDGTYQTVLDMPTLPFYVDSIGLGCALIHRRVFEAIRDAHTLVYIHGVPVPVPNGCTVAVDADFQHSELLLQVGQRLYFAQEAAETSPLARDANWPFFAFNYSRTEDHYFCELAARVGERPLVDPTILCLHEGMAGYSTNELRQFLASEPGRQTLGKYYQTLHEAGMKPPETVPLEVLQQARQK